MGSWPPWLGRYYGGSIWEGGRDIGVVSMVLTLGWEGGTWVFGATLSSMACPVLHCSSTLSH